MEVISDLLGHSSVAVTAIYAKVVNHRKYTPSVVLSKQIQEMLQQYLTISETSGLKIIKERLAPSWQNVVT